MKIFKIEAQDDTVYVQSEDKAEALKRPVSVTGPIPLALLKITEVDALPDDEEFM